MPVKWIAALVASGAAVLSLWWAVGTVLDWKEDAAQLPIVQTQFIDYRAETILAAEKAAAARARDESNLMAAVVELNTIRSQTATLRDIVARKPFVVTREVPRDPDSNTCPDPRLSPAFRLCVNAAVTGGAAAASACEAAGVHDSG